jgi:hypothetical protein
MFAFTRAPKPWNTTSRHGDGVPRPVPAIPQRILLFVIIAGIRFSRQRKHRDIRRSFARNAGNGYWCCLVMVTLQNIDMILF